MLVTFTRIDNRRKIALRADYVTAVSEGHDGTTITWHDPHRPESFSETQRVEEGFLDVVKRINGTLEMMGVAR